MTELFIFWTSVVAIFYAYIGYLLVLKLISLISKSSIKKEVITPSVTLIISAYNEEKIIEKKIENALASEYPISKLEVMVVSDASDDDTEQISHKFEEKGVITIRIEGRVGKTTCLNKAVQQATGEVIIFSDANSMYDKHAIKKMVCNFADINIGFVTGFTRYLINEAGSVGESIGLYSKIEKETKLLESKIGSCVGADGAIFAIRKILYKPLKKNDINDFVIPLNIVEQNYRGILEPDAFCHEETAKDNQGEFARQARITNRTLRAILSNKQLLNILDYGMFSFKLISHKLCKFFVPFFLVSLFLSNFCLLDNGLFFKFIFILQISFYLFVAIGEFSIQNTKVINVAKICNTFFIVNAAILWGWITYFSGKDYTTWKSVR